MMITTKNHRHFLSKKPFLSLSFVIYFSNFLQRILYELNKFWARIKTDLPG